MTAKPHDAERAWVTAMSNVRVHELDADPAVAPLVFHCSRYR